MCIIFFLRDLNGPYPFVPEPNCLRTKTLRIKSSINLAPIDNMMFSSIHLPLLMPLAFPYVLIIYLWLLVTKYILNSTELKCTQSIKLYHFVRTILSVYHFVHTILSVPFCPLPFCPRTPTTHTSRFLSYIGPAFSTMHRKSGFFISFLLPPSGPMPPLSIASPHLLNPPDVIIHTTYTIIPS